MRNQNLTAIFDGFNGNDGRGFVLGWSAIDSTFEVKTHKRHKWTNYVVTRYNDECSCIRTDDEIHIQSIGLKISSPLSIVL